MDKTILGYGIHLGTENACIAISDGTSTEIIKNNEDRELTPCAAWMDKAGNLTVGRHAKERVESDPGNAFSEFKLQMGTGRDYRFERSGRGMKPEELSAEVLKELLASVQKQTGIRPEAAVITVPAAFELPQCDATMKAAKLAGLKVSPLLQEPVAAALAYGFQNEREGAYWLVYDFGGGTFDAAVISVRDGIIDVLTHEGDNHLGGKSINWAIVDELLIPAVAKEYRITEFGRKNPKWRGVIGKLKGAAEEAKNVLSHAESADIAIEFLGQDDDGNPMSFAYTLMRKDVERLAEPLIIRTVNICKNVLSGSRLGVDALTRILMIGEPVQAPWFFNRVICELGTSAECSVGPISVVAKGAAIFASQQGFKAEPVKPTVPGEFVLQLEGRRLGPDTEPLLGGKVLAPRDIALSEFTIEFINHTSPPLWRSGKIGLGPDGSFMTNLWAEKGRVNRFDLELCDAVGKPFKTTPDHWEYEIDHHIPEQPMIHSLSIGLPNNETLIFIEKGASLPARRRKIMATAFPVTKGQKAPLFRVPVVEGEDERADRNKRIGELIISVDTAKRDLPAGTDVEVTIEVDASRMVRVKANIPMLDEEVETTLELGGLDHDLLRHMLPRFECWHDELMRLAQELGHEKALRILQVIVRGMDIGSIAKNGESVPDHDQLDLLEGRLRYGMAEMDRVQTLLQEEKLKTEQSVVLKGLTALYGKSTEGGRQ